MNRKRFFCGFIISFFMLFSGCKSTQRINKLISLHTGKKITGYQAFRNPDRPPGRKITMVPEWANISYLVISDKSVSTIFPNQDEENQFITDFILKACPYVPVLVIISEELRLGKLLCLIRERGELSKVDKGFVKFVFAAHDSKWIRDYGLFFGKDRAGRLFCFDTMYNNIRVGENFEPRPNDEILPQFLLNFMKEQKNSIISVRVPYFLNGGDYYTDGQDTCYISTHSILSNGGSWEEAEAVLKEYFGAEKCIFLHPLPPEIVIPHIDMFFKPVSTDVCLLGRYEQENPDYLYKNLSNN